MSSVQLQRAEKYIEELLQTELPSYMHYHNYDHTVDVLNAASQLAREEKITDEAELLILRTAALFHDCGFVNVYENHEEEGCRIASEILPGFGYDEFQVSAICRLIMKTKINQEPSTVLEKILCDADLDYLGRDDFWAIGEKLFREWKEKGFVSNEDQWNKLQVSFLRSHRYWTNSATKKREQVKIKHLEKLNKFSIG